MDSLIPNLFIITTEISIVLAIVVGILIFFQRKAKQTDMKSVNQLVEDILDNQDFRVKLLTTNLKNNNFSGDSITKAKDLHELEKAFLQEFLNIYLKRDVYRLDNIPSALVELTDEFIIPNAAADDNTTQEAVPTDTTNDVELGIDESKILEEARAIKEEHLKEINQLRLKNTELNEHLFEALETITGLVTEHSKSSGGNDRPSAQQILDSILYLKDQRERVASAPVEAPADTTPSSEETVAKEAPAEEPVDETLFNETIPDLGITDILNTDLESDLNQNPKSEETVMNSETVDEDNTIIGDSDPWADALAEQEQTEAPAEPFPSEPFPSEQVPEESPTENNGTPQTEATDEEDPWANALAEQAEGEATPDSSNSGDTAESNTDEDDPWADALAEQSEAESAPEEAVSDSSEEDDPWADALSEQAEGESKQAGTGDSSAEEEDPWAAALAEQSEAESSPEPTEAPSSEITSDAAEEGDPWADALNEQAEGEAEQAASGEEDDPWADALAEQAEGEAQQADDDEDPWAAALAEQSDAEGKT